jgi:hypothetical protein
MEGPAKISLYLKLELDASKAFEPVRLATQIYWSAFSRAYRMAKPDLFELRQLLDRSRHHCAKMLAAVCTIVSIRAHNAASRIIDDFALQAPSDN